MIIIIIIIIIIILTIIIIIIIIINNNNYNITNLYTGCAFQHKNAVINMCPVKKRKESKTYNNSDKT